MSAQARTCHRRAPAEPNTNHCKSRRGVPVASAGTSWLPLFHAAHNWPGWSYLASSSISSDRVVQIQPSDGFAIHPAAVAHIRACEPLQLQNCSWRMEPWPLGERQAAFASVGRDPNRSNHPSHRPARSSAFCPT